MPGLVMTASAANQPVRALLPSLRTLSRSASPTPAGDPDVEPSVRALLSPDSFSPHAAISNTNNHAHHRPSPVPRSRRPHRAHPSLRAECRRSRRHAMAPDRTHPRRPRPRARGCAESAQRLLYRIRQRRRVALHRLRVHLDPALRRAVHRLHRRDRSGAE